MVFDQAVEGLDLFDDAEQFDFPDREEVGIPGEGTDGLFDGEALLEALGAARAGGMEEGGEGGLATALEGHGIGPLFEQGEVHVAVDIFMEQLEGLRVILLENGLKAIGQGGALVDEFAPGEVEGMQGLGLAVGLLEGPQGAVVSLKKTGDAGGVALIGVSTGELQALTVVPDDRRIERIDLRVGQRAKEQQQVKGRLLEGHPDQDIPVALAQVRPPVPQGGWIGGNVPAFKGRFRFHQTNGDRAVGAVDAEDVFGGFCWHACVHLVILSRMFWTRGGDGNRDGFVSVKASSEESFRPCLKTDRGRVSCRSSQDITFHDSRSVVQSTDSPFPGNPPIFLLPAVPRMLALFAPCG